MLNLLNDLKGGVMSDSQAVFVFTPTTNEYKGVSRHLGQHSFKNFNASLVECGPGTINAHFQLPP